MGPGPSGVVRKGLDRDAETRALVSAIPLVDLLCDLGRVFQLLWTKFSHL